MMRSFLQMLPFLCLLAACNQQSCNSGLEIANRLRDDDGDRWFNDTVNFRCELFVSSVTYISGGGLFQPSLKVSVDDLLICHDSLAFDSTAVASSRCVGTWHLNEADAFDFRSRFRISLGDIYSAQETSISWTNNDSTFERSINGFQVRFRTKVTMFADPNPQFDGDCDADGILDSQEAGIAGRHKNLGDPERKDLLVGVGYTHPDWKLTPKSKLLIVRSFANEGINLFLAEGSEVTGVDGGQVRFGNDPLPRDMRTTINIGDVIVGNQVSPSMSGFVRYAILSEHLDCNNLDSYGCNRGATILVKSHLLTGPDVYEYQGKTLMHELGHSLGLCHPTDTECATGVLPQNEQNPAITAMGTPREDEGDPLAFIFNALNRPMDYTDSQWDNLRLDFGLSTSPGCEPTE